MMIVYQVRHISNGKIYVGITKHSLDKRIDQHFHSVHKSPFHAALRKYGTDAFEFSIIEKVQTWAHAQERERFWISELKCKYPNGYNLTDGGDGNQGFTPEVLEKLRAANRGRKHTDEWKAMMRERMTGRNHTAEVRNRLSILRTGFRQSPETRKKLSEIQAGKKRGPYSAEHREAISAGQKGKIITEEQRRKISRTLQGNIPWNKGKKLSAEHRENLRLSHIGNKPSDETRQKMSESQRIAHARRRKRG